MFYKGSSITSHIADKLATEAALGECPSTITVQKASKTDSVKESSETTEEQDKAGLTPEKARLPPSSFKEILDILFPFSSSQLLC